jgi:hypothetical protein
MGVLHWDVETIRPLWEHALCAGDWREPHSPQGRGPGLLLVKDLGCYLMSNGEPGWARPNRTHVVAYSDELGEEERWGFLARLCGPEDFTDLIDTETCLRVFSRRGGRLVVTFLPGVRSVGVRRNR